MINKIKSLFEKYRELIVYVICGGLTTVINFIVQYLSGFVLRGEKFLEIRTVAAWCAAVIFAFFVNKIFVFRDTAGRSGTEPEKVSDGRRGIAQFITFTGMRVLSLGMEVVIMSVGVRFLGANEFICKLIAQVLVVISNYFFSKLIIFKKK